MSSPRDDRYHRRTPAPQDTHGGLFQPGQGGRTVLPPISTAFPTSHFPVPASYNAPYPQSRSPGRYDYTNASPYNQWPGSGGQPSSHSSYGYYDPHHHDSHYPADQPYHHGHPVDSRKLPPLSMPHSYVPGSGMDSTSHIRSPTASYPVGYPPYPSAGNSGAEYGYGYGMGEHHGHPTMGHPSHSSLAAAVSEPRSSSPYHHHTLPHPHPRGQSPPPISPTSAEEPTVKKKRKRADAHQLKILTETYNRTAFPSTEERMELAKLLDMTPRSVQIWFQNRRQSMRQTRQTAASSSSHQPFAMSDPSLEDVGSSASYNVPPGASYGGDPSHSSSRRGGRSSHDDPRKSSSWGRSY